MRGHVLGYDNGQGVISGDDGSRYTFTAADWKGTGPAAAGATVDFVGAEGVARDVYQTGTATGTTGTTGTTGSYGSGFGAGVAGTPTMAAAPSGAPSDGSLIGRAKNILTNPQVEWQAIAAEPMTVKQIMTYVGIAIGDRLWHFALVIKCADRSGLSASWRWHAGFRRD